MYIWDPPEARDALWNATYGKAQIGLPICGALLDPKHPYLVCTRRQHLKSDLHHIAHTATGEEIAESHPQMNPGHNFHANGAQGVSTPWPQGKFLPTNVAGAPKVFPAPPAQPAPQAAPPAQQAPVIQTAPPSSSLAKNKNLGNPDHPMFARYTDEGEMTDYDLLPDAD